MEVCNYSTLHYIESNYLNFDNALNNQYYKLKVNESYKVSKCLRLQILGQLKEFYAASE